MASSPPADAPMPTMGNEPPWSRWRAAAGALARVLSLRPGSCGRFLAAGFLERLSTWLSPQREADLSVYTPDIESA